MATRVKNIQFIGGIDSDTPDFSVDPRYCRDLVNFEPTSTGLGFQTVKGYQRYSHGRTATDAAGWYIMYFNNGSAELNEDDEIYQGTDKAYVLADATVTSGSYAGGDAEGYVYVLFEDNVFSDGVNFSDGSTDIGTTVSTAYMSGPDLEATEYLALSNKARSIFAENMVDEVPGSGAIIGVFQLNGDVYAIRNIADGSAAHFYKDDATNGWDEVSGVSIDAGGTLKFIIHNFGSGTKLYGLTGNSKPFEFDGSSLVEINTTIPDPYRPTLIAEINNQLVVYYPETSSGGSLMLSVIGDPTDFSDTSAGAAEIKVNFNVTNLQNLVDDNLAIMGDNIDILSFDSSGDPVVSSFARGANVSANSAQSLTDALYIANTNLYSMSATNRYGNFELNSLNRGSKDLISTFLQNNDIVFSMVALDKSQYRIHVSRTLIVFTFLSDRKVLVSRQSIPDTFNCVSNVVTESQEDIFYYGDSGSGYVYRGDDGYTFDTEQINSYMTSSCIPIVSTQHKCRFRKAFINADLGSSETSISFCYDDVDTMRTGRETYGSYDKVELNYGRWDMDSWDTFVWAPTSAEEGDDEVLNIYLNGTAPTLTFCINSRNMGQSPAKFNAMFLHYSIRGRLR